MKSFPAATGRIETFKFEVTRTRITSAVLFLKIKLLERKPTRFIHKTFHNLFLTSELIILLSIETSINEFIILKKLWLIPIPNKT